MGAPAAPEVSEVLEALEATLPEDAPAGHEAWQKVKFTDKRAGPYSYFYFGSQRFQTTLKSCLTEQALLRVTRACYVKFSEGQPKERVIEFRDQVYDRIKGIPPEKRRRLLEATGAALAAPPAAGAEEGPVEQRRGAPAAASAPAAAPPAAEASGADAAASDAAPPAAEASGADAAASSAAPPAAATSPDEHGRWPGGDNGKTYATAEGARIADAIASVRRRSANAKASERRRRKRQKQERRLAAGFAVDGAGAERGVDDEPERVAKAKAKDKAKGEGEPGGGSAQPAGREDAPEGHEAWSKVRFAPSTNSVKLNLGTLKLNLAFQTTVIACGGSRDEAERVARLCWVKFAEGASRDEVVAYRQALYDALAQGARAGAAPARAAAGAGAHAGDEVADLEAAKRDLKAQGRLEGSLLVEGRSAERKNASINGLYARRAADQDGHGAYEKVGADAAARPRFLYYCREKSRWKIDCNIPSKKSGFAYLKVDGVATPAEAGPDCKWHVCDEKGEGYNKDPRVRCVEVAPGPGSGAPAAGSVAPSAQPDNSASDDDTSSDGDRTSGDEESSSESGSGARAAPGAAAWTAPGRAAGVVPRRACAKMLVRSGLRCVCHFSVLRDCPGR